MPSYHQNVCWPSEETDLFNSLVDQTSGWNTLFTNSIYENNLQKQLQNQNEATGYITCYRPSTSFALCWCLHDGIKALNKL